LERKEKYIVKSENGIYKGLYLSQPRYYFPYIVLKFVTKNENGKMYNIPEAIFDKEDTFYDAEKYINKIKDMAKNARKNMEARALDKILKRVVNETFHWF
jgi:hypothetical protein